MRKLKGVLALLGAIALGVFLVVGWEFLGSYAFTLKFLPDVPLFGARLVVGILALGAVMSAVENLRGTPEIQVTQTQS
jgi:hypothetical protein